MDGMSSTYHITDRTELEDVTIVTITEWPAARRWTLISTAHGEDVVVSPAGRHTQDHVGTNERSVSTAVDNLLEWVADNV